MYKHKLTQFEKRWGIHAQDLAHSEGVDTPAIHMRVYHWGTPWQRARKPTQWEKQYGKSLAEMCTQYKLNPWTMLSRHLEGKAFDAPTNADYDYDPARWGNNARRPFWLHPEHPDYELARAGNLSEAQIAQIQNRYQEKQHEQTD